MKNPDDIIRALIKRHNNATNMMTDRYDIPELLEVDYQNACEVEYCVMDITNRESTYRSWFFEKTINADYLFRKLKNKHIREIKAL